MRESRGSQARDIHASLTNKMRDGTTMSSKEIDVELKASE